MRIFLNVTIYLFSSYLKGLLILNYIDIKSFFLCACSSPSIKMTPL